MVNQFKLFAEHVQDRVIQKRASVASGTTMCEGKGQLEFRPAGYNKLNIKQKAVQ